MLQNQQRRSQLRAVAQVRVRRSCPQPTEVRRNRARRTRVRPLTSASKKPQAWTMRTIIRQRREPHGISPKLASLRMPATASFKRYLHFAGRVCPPESRPSSWSMSPETSSSRKRTGLQIRSCRPAAPLLKDPRIKSRFPLVRPAPNSRSSLTTGTPTKHLTQLDCSRRSDRGDFA